MKELSDIVKFEHSDKTKQLYYETKQQVYQENKHLLRFAKYVDKWAKGLAGPSAAIDAVTLGGILGVLPSMAMDFLKKVPKLSFLGYYGAKSHDVVGTIGNLLYEAGSLVPLGGELLDFHERYARKTEDYIERETIKRVKKQIKKKEESIKEFEKAA